MESSWDNAGRQGQTILTCDPIKNLLTICHWSTETIHPLVVKNYHRKISVLVYILVDPLCMDEYSTAEKQVSSKSQKYYKPEGQAPGQTWRRGPSTLLSWSSTRITLHVLHHYD